MKRKLAIAAASFAITLALGRGALVSISTNTTLGGGSVSAEPGTPTSALQQEWWGVSIFHTNVFLFDKPTVPLHERLSGIDLPFIPRWPTWYKLGSSDTNDTPDAASSSGLFYTFLGGMFLQSRNASLRLRARGDGLSAPASVEISSEKGGVDISAGNTANLSAKSFTVTSTVATSGITLTNSAAGDFTVTWNGLTLTNWTDLAQWFIPKWPSWYQFGEEGDPPPVGAVGLFRDIWKITLRNTNDVDIVADGTNPMAIVPGAGVNISAPQGAVRIGAGMSASQMPILNKGLILGSTNGVIIDAPSVEASGGVKAASFTVGTNNIGEAVASVERRVGVVETGEYWFKWTAASMSASEVNWPEWFSALRSSPLRV